MLKVVHINHSDFGGAAIAAVRVHKGMLAAGINSKFLTFVKTHDEFPEHYLLNQVTCSRFPFLIKVKLLWRRVLKKAGLREDFEEKHVKNRPEGYELFTFPFADFDFTIHPLVQEADIIHLHWVARGLLDYASFFQNKKRKIVWTFHDMNPFTGGCHHADGSKGYEKDCYPCPQLRNTVDESLPKKVLALKQNAIQSFPKDQITVVTPSKWLLEISSSSVVFKGIKKVCIPNGVNKNTFKHADKVEARKKLRLPLDARILLFVSLDIHNRRKGMQPLLEAISRLPSHHNIVICTLGNQKNIDLPGAISLGYIRDERKLAYAYSAADVFVLPSLAENFPNVICESLMCGTPVVANNVGGIPEQINATNGKLVDTGNIEQLTNVILEVLNADHYDKENISAAAASKYDIEIVTRQYIEVYNNLLYVS